MPSSALVYLRETQIKRTLRYTFVCFSVLFVCVVRKARVSVVAGVCYGGCEEFEKRRSAWEYRFARAGRAREEAKRIRGQKKDHAILAWF